MNHSFKAAFILDGFHDESSEASSRGARFFKVRYCTTCKMAAPYGFTYEPIKERIINKKEIKGWSHDYSGCREIKNDKK